VAGFIELAEVRAPADGTNAGDSRFGAKGHWPLGCFVRRSYTIPHHTADSLSIFAVSGLF
jgi:hypothetical protein